MHAINGANALVTCQTNGAGSVASTINTLTTSGTNVMNGNLWASSFSHAYASQNGIKAPYTIDYGTVGGNSDYYPAMRSVSQAATHGYRTQVDFGVLRSGANWGIGIIRVASDESSDGGAIFQFNKSGEFYSPTSRSSEVYTNGWFRSIGSGGWYSETHGGGMYMEDSTWVRTYGSKQFYVGSGASNAIHSAGGLNMAGGGYFGQNVNCNSLSQRSDIKFKSNITDIDTSAFMNIEFKEYDKTTDDGKVVHDMGVIAQQIEPHMGYIVDEILYPEGVYKSVNYNPIFVMSAKITQEHEIEIYNLKKQVEELTKLVKQLIK